MNRIFTLLDDTGQAQLTFRQECALAAARGFVVMVILLVASLLAGVVQ